MWRGFKIQFKIQGEGERVPELLHYRFGKSADPAFEAHGGQRAQTLDIRYGFAIQERKPGQ